MKKLFIRALISMDEDTNDYALSVIKDNIAGNLVWIKKGRAYERKRNNNAFFKCLIKARISLIFIKNQNVVFIMP